MLAAALLAAACGGETAPVPTATNVLLLTIDTLRADHLGCYGYPLPTSPAMDGLAEGGVRFENAIVQRGGTWPSLTSILTSLHPRSHGVRLNGEQLDASKRILAEELSDRGYATAAFLTNMINAPNRGFDHKFGAPKGPRDASATREAIDWLGAHRSQPFFVWLHLLGPHDPYVPAKPFKERFNTGYEGPLHGGRGVLEAIYQRKRSLSEAELAHLVSLYDGDVAEADTHVAALLEALDRLGLAERTLVVLSSDHGEELYEHNHYFFHSNSIYEGVLRVPLVLRLPGVLAAGAVVEPVVESVDIAPTVLELLDLAVPASYQGRSLLPAMVAAAAGEPPPASELEPAAISELGPEIFSIRTPRWHYIHNPREHRSPNPRHRDKPRAREYFRIEREELYDVRADPRETRNLVGEHPEVAARLRERLLRWVAAEDSDYRPSDLSPEVEEELRALGYID